MSPGPYSEDFDSVAAEPVVPVGLVASVAAVVVAAKRSGAAARAAG